ncbi:MAG: hypothetical protein GYB50_03985 [Rhodobacteraceae bacterium]|nr:hypothetical protein [Paracoccaceae bacterium]
MAKPKGRPRALRYESKKTRTVAHRTGTAAAVIGPLAPGVRVTGLTAGQFSSIDALEHMVDQMGPADVRISTWTTGIYDIERTRAIQVDGRMRDVRVLLDRGTFEKSPKFAGPLIEKLGVDAFRCLSVHAKVNIVIGERGSAVMRSSMNLNKNLRTEQFDIDVCEDVTEFYRRWFDALWEQSAMSNDNRAIIQAVFDRYLASPDEVDGKPSEQAPARPLVEDEPFDLSEVENWGL